MPQKKKNDFLIIVILIFVVLAGVWITVKKNNVQPSIGSEVQPISVQNQPVTSVIQGQPLQGESIPANITEMSFESNSEIQKWNKMALRIIASTQTSPPEASRFLAMMHIAAFEAVNSIDQRYEPYLAYLPLNVDVLYNKEIVAAAAAKQVIDTIYPQYKILTLKHFVRGDLLQSESAKLGKASAAQILNARREDGHDKVEFYTISGKIGEWNATPPYFETALLPHWGNVDLFAATSQAIYPEAPSALNTQEYATEFKEVFDLGEKNSPYRTADQSEIAHFWADGKRTFTPPGHWNLIASKALEQKPLALEEELRLFALLNIAIVDAGIQTWKAKFDYQYWRPIDAIHYASNDGNDLTQQLPTWSNYIETPNFPEYPSGHSAFSGAGSQVLALIIDDNTRFTTYSLGLPGVTRSYNSFSEAAEEAGMSRIYGGIHFQKANTEGLRIGREIAESVFANILAKK